MNYSSAGRRGGGGEAGIPGTAPRHSSAPLIPSPAPSLIPRSPASPSIPHRSAPLLSRLGSCSAFLDCSQLGHARLGLTHLLSPRSCSPCLGRTLLSPSYLFSASRGSCRLVESAQPLINASLRAAGSDQPAGGILDVVLTRPLFCPDLTVPGLIVCEPQIGALIAQMQGECRERECRCRQERCPGDIHFTHQLLTCSIVRPVSCASCFFWSSDG